MDTLEAYDGAVVAVATVFIAAFTVATVLVTERLAKLTRASIRLARSEFIASHRPRIVTRSFEPTSAVASNQKGILRFTYVNVGDTPATIVCIGAIITGNSEPGLSLQEKLLDPPIQLAGGQRRTWLVETDDPPMGGEAAFCIGCIIYKDALGQTRQTGFCRQFRPASGRWIRQTHSEYEYQD